MGTRFQSDVLVGSFFFVTCHDVDAFTGIFAALVRSSVPFPLQLSVSCFVAARFPGSTSMVLEEILEWRRNWCLLFSPFFYIFLLRVAGSSIPLELDDSLSLIFVPSIFDFLIRVFGRSYDCPSLRICSLFLTFWAIWQLFLMSFDDFTAFLCECCLQI